jgi:hypothetical protein
MNIFYLSVDGTGTREKAKIRDRMIEMPDGYHPVTNDSVWQDSKRTRDSIMVIIQGVRKPYGGTMEDKDIELLLYDMELRERSFKRQSVSKMSWRFLGRMGEWVVKFGPMIVMGAVIAWALYDSFMPKGGP